MEDQNLKFSEGMRRAEAASYLRALAQAIDDGSVCIQTRGKTLILDAGEEMLLSLKAKRRADRHAISVTLAWPAGGDDPPGLLPKIWPSLPGETEPLASSPRQEAPEVPQRDDAARVSSAPHVRETELSLLTLEQLYLKARDMDIADRSQMDKPELVQALASACAACTKNELYERAQDLGVECRSTMSRDELVEALLERAPDEEGAH